MPAWRAALQPMSLDGPMPAFQFVIYGLQIVAYRILSWTKAMTEKLIPFDPARYLRTPQEITAYLEAVFEDYGHDYRTVVKALGDVARAQGMQKIAKAPG